MGKITKKFPHTCFSGKFTVKNMDGFYVLALFSQSSKSFFTIDDIINDNLGIFYFYLLKLEKLFL